MKIVRAGSSRGFTSAEMLVATAIAAVVVGAAALGYSALAGSMRNYTQVATVNIGSTAMNAFYGQNTNTISAYIAPNFGSLARAEALREEFVADTMQSVAVYCLYRSSGTFNGVHPTTIPSPAYGTAMDTPEGFRLYLNSAVAGASSVFNISYRNTYPSPNYSIYFLGYSSNSTTIPVVAVYDVDFVAATDTSTGAAVGTYASVKRYLNGSLSGDYDVVYRTGDNTDQFQPPVVAFERRARLAVTEGATSIDRFKVAAEQPFYFIFWPDPARDQLKLPLPNTATSLNASFSNTDPRQAYNHLAGRTSFMFTVPMFPSS